MKQSEIKFMIELDEEKIPEKIFWKATDSESEGPEEAKAIALAIWDHQRKETLRIDLWGKDMLVDEMKYFYIDIIAGLANSLRTSVDDNVMAGEMESLCEKLARHVQENAGQKK